MNEITQKNRQALEALMTLQREGSCRTNESIFIMIRRPPSSTLSSSSAASDVYKRQDKNNVIQTVKVNFDDAQNCVTKVDINQSK